MMKRIAYLLITVALFLAMQSQACTEEELRTLDKEISETQKKDFEEKSARLDNYLQQIKTKKNLSDKELFAYRTVILNNPKAKKLHDKERKITFGDLMRIDAEKDCKTLKNWSDESLISANKQWNIVFTELEKELNNNVLEK